MRKTMSLIVISSLIIAFLFSAWWAFVPKYIDDTSDLWMTPWKSITTYFRKTEKYDISKLFRKKNDKNDGVLTENSKRYWDFVLDCSGSVSEGGPIEKPEWYKSNLDKVKEYIGVGNRVLREYEEGEKIEIFRIAKISLSALLIDLAERNNESFDEYFSVWKLGNEGELLYPQALGKESEGSTLHNAKKITKNTVKAAIMEIMKQTNTHNNTDFTDLLKKMEENYQNEEYEGTNNHLIITFFSDLLHDVGNKHKGESSKIKHNIDSLENLIKGMRNFNSNIIANMLITTKDGETPSTEQGKIQIYLEQGKIQIYDQIKRSLDTNRTYENGISDKWRMELLSKPVKGNQPLILYFDKVKPLNDIYLIADKKYSNLELQFVGNSEENLKGLRLWLECLEPDNKKCSQNHKREIIEKSNDDYSADLKKGQFIKLKPIEWERENKDKSATVELLLADNKFLNRVKVPIRLKQTMDFWILILHMFTVLFLIFLICRFFIISGSQIWNLLRKFRNS